MRPRLLFRPHPGVARGRGAVYLARRITEARKGRNRVERDFSLERTAERIGEGYTAASGRY